MKEKLTVRLFVRRNVFNATKSGECRELVLRHLAVGAKSGSEVHRWEIEAHHKSQDGVDSLVDEIETFASSDANGWQGVQTYALLAFHGDNERQTARFVFRVDGSSDEDEDNDYDSEPKNLKGALAQQMRHNELIMKTSMTNMATVMNVMQRTMNNQAARLESMENDRVKSIHLFEQLMSEQHTRDMEARRIEAREKALTEVVGSLKQALPIVATKLLGPKKEEGQPSGAETVLQKIVEGFMSMSPEQKAAMYNMLSDEQREQFKDLFSVMAPN